MNTTLSTTPGRHDHPPQQVALDAQVALDVPGQTRRVGVLDRMALHLGVALVAWSRRPRATESRDDRTRRHENRVDEMQRRREAERLLRMTVPGL